MKRINLTRSYLNNCTVIEYESDLETPVLLYDGKHIIEHHEGSRISTDSIVATFSPKAEKEKEVKRTIMDMLMLAERYLEYGSIEYEQDRKEMDTLSAEIINNSTQIGNGIVIEDVD